MSQHAGRNPPLVPDVLKASQQAPSDASICCPITIAWGQLANLSPAPEALFS
jgi:hypothetical protein